MISKFFIDRPRFAFVIAILTTMCGLIAIPMMPVAQYPNITPSQVQISAMYPGADAMTVQDTVIQPLENQINGVEGMLYMSSISADSGSATITVTFDIGSNGNMNTVNTQNRANWANAQLPESVKQQGVIVKEKSSNMLMVVTLYSPKGTHDALFLNNYATNYIKDELSRIDGIGDIAFLGELKYSMRIWLDPQKLASLGMSVSEIAKAIKAQNVQVSSGALGESPSPQGQVNRYVVQTEGRLSEVEEFENIVIKALPDGANVKISDVGRVELGAERYSSSGSLNGQPAALMAIYQRNDANGLQISQQCRTVLEDLSKSFPDDLEFGCQYDTTNFINASIEEVVITLIEAVLLVILVTFIFLQNWRMTLVPTLAIPVSLIGTFAVLESIGYSINLITLFGMILAIGIVVDDAIVVIENICRLMDEEKLSPKEAAIKSMEEVTGPVVATTAVLLAMFIPVCFLSGITGEIYRQFGITISVAVAISALNALTFSPALSAILLKSDNSHKKKFIFFRWFDRFFDYLTAFYGSVVGGLVKVSLAVLIVYFGLMFLTMKLYNAIPSGFVPAEDQGAFFVSVQLPDAASLERTDAVVAKVCKMIEQQPGVADVITASGYNILTSTNSSNNAFIIVVLKPWADRTRPELEQKQIIMALQKHLSQVPEAIVMAFDVPPIPGIGVSGGFSFVLQDTLGSDPVRMQDALNTLIAAANQTPGLKNVFSTYRSAVPLIFAKIDREKVLKMGVSLEDVNDALASYLGYSYINDFNKYDKVYKVEIQAEPQYRSSTTDIEKIYVKNNKNQMVPLSSFVELEKRFAPQYLTKYNMFSSATVQGEPAEGYSSGEAMKLMEELAAKVLPDGFKNSWTDMSYQEKVSEGQVGVAYALAVLFIYLFLVALYESWMVPMAVVLSIPIALLGALLLLFSQGIEENIYTQVGFILLFGIACKTAILIVEFAKQKHEDGMELLPAAVFAAKLRFRAVLMTAISFILGTLPLVMASGPGANSRQALGSAVVGGMTVSVVIGTFLIPAFYVACQKMVEMKKNKKTEETK